MKFKLEINCDNAAFGDDATERYSEIARILKVVAQDMEDGHSAVVLRDINGNKVGTAEFWKGVNE